MNFLAHLYLAGDSEPIIIGNFIGDFVKGRLKQQYTPAILQGIFLHRCIDTYTDRHEVVIKSKKKLQTRYRHYSGVLVDMFYDHILARNWERFHQKDLKYFTEDVYSILLKNEPLFPEKAKFLLPYMVRENWLLNYREINCIDGALKGMARRTKFKSGMETGVEYLQLHYLEFEQEFLLFFPELIKYVSEEMNKIHFPQK
ncbi:MAG: ACP phosphodiesterase [Bacteroidota bacterium]|nr:ACP phosphodiesterase [Bacteroidota bacterium]